MEVRGQAQPLSSLMQFTHLLKDILAVKMFARVGLWVFYGLDNGIKFLGYELGIGGH